MQHCSMRMDILYFLDYDIDDELPWHSTISRTRNLYPEDVFEEVFTKVFRQCVKKGMVSGHTQAIDAAPVKANASMESLELKVPKEELKEHLKQVRYMSSPDREESKRKAKNDKSDDAGKTIQATDQQLKEIKNRNQRWKATQDQRIGANNNNAKYTSNHTNYSPEGRKATFKKTKDNGKGQLVNHYGTARKDCRGCPIADQCKGKSHEKRFNVTYYREEYERAIERVTSNQRRLMKKKRQSTVEPVFGM